MTDPQPDARTAMYANAISDAAWYVDGVDQAATAAMALADTELAALEQECRDRECTESDVRARLADAENALAKVREVADRWAEYADRCQNHPENPHRPRMFWDVAARKLHAELDYTCTR